MPIERERSQYTWVPTADLLTELEGWLWLLTELETDTEANTFAWSETDSSRTYLEWHIATITHELEWREERKERPTAPAWPSAAHDARPDAAAIKDRLLVTDYLERLGVELIRQGRRWWAHCPLPGHDDDKPSFMIDDDERSWRCWGCTNHGDLFTLHLLLSGHDDFARAVRELAERTDDISTRMARRPA